MLSFSPPERQAVYRRVIVKYDSDDEAENIDTDCANTDSHIVVADGSTEHFEGNSLSMRDKNGNSDPSNENGRQSRKRHRNENAWKRNIVKQASHI